MSNDIVTKKKSTFLNNFKMQKLKSEMKTFKVDQLVKTTDDHYIIFSGKTIFKSVNSGSEALLDIEKLKNGEISLGLSNLFEQKTINDVKDDVSNIEILDFYKDDYSSITRTNDKEGNELVVGIRPGSMDDLTHSIINEGRKYIKTLNHIYHEDDVLNLLNTETDNITPGELKLLTDFLNNNNPNIKDFSVNDDTSKPDIMAYKSIELVETLDTSDFVFNEYKIVDSNDSDKYIVYKINGKNIEEIINNRKRFKLIKNDNGDAIIFDLNINSDLLDTSLEACTCSEAYMFQHDGQKQSLNITIQTHTIKSISETIQTNTDVLMDKSYCVQFENPYLNEKFTYLNCVMHSNLNSSKQIFEHILDGEWSKLSLDGITFDMCLTHFEGGSVYYKKLNVTNNFNTCELITNTAKIHEHKNITDVASSVDYVAISIQISDSLRYFILDKLNNNKIFGLVSYSRDMTQTYGVVDHILTFREYQYDRNNRIDVKSILITPPVEYYYDDIPNGTILAKFDGEYNSNGTPKVYSARIIDSLKFTSMVDNKRVTNIYGITCSDKIYYLTTLTDSYYGHAYGYFETAIISKDSPYFIEPTMDIDKLSAFKFDFKTKFVRDGNYNIAWNNNQLDIIKPSNGLKMWRLSKYLDSSTLPSSRYIVNNGGIGLKYIYGKRKVNSGGSKTGFRTVFRIDIHGGGTTNKKYLYRLIDFYNDGTTYHNTTYPYLTRFINQIKTSIEVDPQITDPYAGAGLSWPRTKNVNEIYILNNIIDSAGDNVLGFFIHDAHTNQKYTQMIAEQKYYVGTLGWGQGYKVKYIDDFIDSSVTEYECSVNYKGWGKAAETTFYTDEAETPQTIIGSTGYLFNEPGPLYKAYPHDDPNTLYVI